MSNCALPHDPEPYVQSGLAMTQANWMGPWKFKPRKEFCSNEVCYEAGQHRTREEESNGQQ